MNYRPSEAELVTAGRARWFPDPSGDKRPGRYAIVNGVVIFRPAEARPLSKFLSYAAVFAVALIVLGFLIGVFRGGFWGVLFPLGLTVWWVVGLIARKQDPQSAD